MESVLLTKNPVPSSFSKTMRPDGTNLMDSGLGVFSV